MNNNFGIYDNSFRLILDTIKNFPEIEKVIIYGSRAMGNYKKGSDIDLAIVGNKINDQTTTRLSSILNQELNIPYFTEIIDYNKITNKDLIEHINTKGKVIYERVGAGRGSRG